MFLILGEGEIQPWARPPDRVDVTVNVPGNDASRDKPERLGRSVHIDDSDTVPRRSWPLCDSNYTKCLYVEIIKCRNTRYFYTRNILVRGENWEVIVQLLFQMGIYEYEDMRPLIYTQFYIKFVCNMKLEYRVMNFLEKRNIAHIMHHVELGVWRSRGL